MKLSKVMRVMLSLNLAQKCDLMDLFGYAEIRGENTKTVTRKLHIENYRRSFGTPHAGQRGQEPRAVTDSIWWKEGVGDGEIRHSFGGMGKICGCLAT
jgi:hypothetical protein